MMHIDKSCHAYIPAEDYTIAHLLRSEGVRIYLEYDFGDRWQHYIEASAPLLTVVAKSRLTDTF